MAASSPDGTWTDVAPTGRRARTMGAWTAGGIGDRQVCSRGSATRCCSSAGWRRPHRSRRPTRSATTSAPGGLPMGRCSGWRPSRPRHQPTSPTTRRAWPASGGPSRPPRSCRCPSTWCPRAATAHATPPNQPPASTWHRRPDRTGATSPPTPGPRRRRRWRHLQRSCGWVTATPRRWPGPVSEGCWGCSPPSG